MNSELFRLNMNDLVRSILVAIGIAVITALYAISIKEGFDVFSADWAGIGKMMVNNAFITATGVLFQSLVSDEDGALGGVL